MRADLGARGAMSLLYHGAKAVDVLQASLQLGLLSRLDAGPVTLAELSQRLEAVPGRLYKLLDCLESLGFVDRVDRGDALLDTTYRSREPLHDAAMAVFGPDSIERGRDAHDGWRQLHGRLPDVLRGRVSIGDDAFSWPPRTDAQVERFERSMAIGCAPIADSFVAATVDLWGPVDGRPPRLLDVGGGDGTLGRRLVETFPALHVDVYNLPVVAPLAARVREGSTARTRLGFVGGDFLAEPLPSGYDALSFVRVLHDWPAATARELLRKAFAALPPGGRLLVSEELRTRERLAVQFFWTYFLVGVDACVSRLREADWYLGALAELGFVDTRVVPGAFDVIVATRP